MLRARWPAVPIEELCARVTSGGTPSRSNPAYYDGGTIPWIKTGELRGWYVDEISERITPSAVRESSAKVFPPETVLLAMYGDGKTMGSVGLIRTPAATNQACCAMLADPKKCDPKFLMYSLVYFRPAILKLAISGAQRNLNGKSIKQFSIGAPPIEVQHRIASILSAYDDLIENNTRRIAILEEMARRIYEEWFVRFRFPGHEGVRMVESVLGLVPEGWSVQGLYDVADLTYGFAFKANLFTEGGEGLGVIRIRDIRDDYTGTHTTEDVDRKYRVSDGDILVGMDGAFHMGRWAGGVAWLNQRVVRFRPKAGIPQSWLFWVTKEPIKTLEATIVGTTVAHLSARDLKENGTYFGHAKAAARVSG